MFKKFAVVLASVVALAFSAGCSTTGGTTPTAPTQAQIAAFAAAAQVKIAAACTIFKPTMTSIAVILVTVPAVAAVSDGVNLACAANSTLDTSTVSNLINTSIPTAITDISNSSFGNKTAIAAGLTVFQSLLSVALAEYNLSVANGAAVSLTSATAPKLSVKLVQ